MGSGRLGRMFVLNRAGDESRPLVTGALLFRWVWLLWMTGLTAVGSEELLRLGLAWLSIGAAGLWTIWMTVARASLSRGVLAVDLALSAGLILTSALVVSEGQIISGRPFFATGYPLSTPLLWGAVHGPGVGAATAMVLAAAHLLSRPLNGVALSDLSPGQVQSLTGAMLNYLVAGIAIGLVARLLERSAKAVRHANQATLKEREMSARLAERQSLARAIHDSALQALALIHKRGNELAASSSIPAEEVGRLAELAGDQAGALRSLILREPELRPAGRASLRDALETAAGQVDEIQVSVGTIGPVWLDRHRVDELQAAVRQALENIVQHARAKSATVFAEEEASSVVVSVRDDGIGFDYDEAQLQADGKVGILESMKGRAEDLGGTMTIVSGRLKGTEVEFRIPRDGTDD